MLLDEPEGQHLFALSTALSPAYVEYYIAQALPCITRKQIAAKMHAKGQQPLDNYPLIEQLRSTED